MKIAIDARFIGPEGTGIGRYILNLLTNLEEIDHINEYYVFVRSSNYNIFNPTNPNFKKIIVDARWYSFKEQLLLPLALYKLKPDLLHVPHFNIPVFYFGKFVITIHDIIKSEYAGKAATLRNPVFYQIKHFIYDQWVLRQAGHLSKKVITPTETSKKKIVKYLGLSEEKVVVTYESADEKFFEWGQKKIEQEKINIVLKKYFIKKPFILYVGNSFPYKNLDRLIEALKLLPKDLHLVNPCTRSDFYDKLADKVREEGVSDRVILPGYVPDEDLVILYRAAEAYVFPSLSEGFGLPALEAMASKLPVVCSDIPALREICGDNVVYFDPYDSSNIAQKISQILEDKKLRDKMIVEGLERAKQFSWRKMAAQTLQVYEEATK